VATTKNDLRRWFKQGVKNGATHMIVVCDTFDHDDYPVYVSPQEDVHVIEKEKSGASMQKVMEVYNLKLPMDKQIDGGVLQFNY